MFSRPLSCNITRCNSIQIVEMSVHMDCSGCESKIRKALKKLHGVHDVDIDMERQKVTVMGWVDQKKALKAVRRTGRRAVLWPYPMNAEEAMYNQEYYHPQHVADAPAHHRHLIFDAVPHSYNYRKHGYDDSSLYGYYQNPPHSHIIDERASMMFNDDNPNACSIM
ncbi:heavy metal-associated isoprenylated plant protein 20-like [Canna indica]|uniref:Heavy metal-associated isoprenylated plant protein 20-like n=1 Tax=Canna indica TaxID=4628 RepID=A0AAQ3QEP4_9LILI|nr:heavy metal-associated isoprenylated plant protein 20-like [Canna indica]